MSLDVLKKMIFNPVRLATLLFVFCYSCVSVADESNPGTKIEQFHAVLIEVMKSNAELHERYVTLEAAVDATFDMNTVSRMSMGKPWRKLEADARQEFKQLMRELITLTYADRFNSYDEHVFEVISVSESRPGRWLVRTRLIRKTGKPVLLDYYLKDQRVFNVVANGVSDLAVRRADYASVIKSDGVQGLLDSVRTNIAELRNES